MGNGYAGKMPEIRTAVTGMEVQISHNTVYNYSAPVFPEPHIIRLNPRRDKHICIVSASMNIVPKPAGTNDIIENNGTLAVMAWFDKITDILEINAGISLKVEEFNPFDFLIYPSIALALPMVYKREWALSLSPYLGSKIDVIPEIKQFALRLAQDCSNDTIEFLRRLCLYVFSEFSYEKRETGAAYSPLKTLKDKKGACRDFAVFSMAVCRHLGLACRYVSGYYIGEEAGELHAWIEVFLPGAGWKGFDPSHGIACDYRHIVLSAAADPVLTLPVEGVFRGNAASKMTAGISINVK